MLDEVEVFLRWQTWTSEPRSKRAEPTIDKR